MISPENLENTNEQILDIPVKSADLTRPFDLLSLIKDHVTDEKQRITPIGAIQFGQNKKLVLIGEDDFGKLRTCYIESPEGFSKELVGEKGRVYDFNDFEDLQIAQVNLSPTKVRTFRSIRTRPSVSVNMSFADPDTGKQNTYNTDENQLLRVFTGEEGGIAVFDGAGLPESNALVFEKKAADKRYGLVFFFHPEESDFGIDSVTGLGEFLNQLNNEFRDNASFPMQEKALTAFNRLFDFGFFNDQIDSDVRLELLRTQIIAHVRRSRDNGPEHMEFLKTVLPNFQPNFVGSVMDWLGIYMTDMGYRDRLNSSIDKLILKDNNEKPANTLAVKQDVKKEIASSNLPKILQELVTPKAKALRETIGDYYAKDSQPMNRYLETLAEMVSDAKTPEEFDDVAKLIKEFDDTRYSSFVAGYYRSTYRPENVKGQRLRLRFGEITQRRKLLEKFYSTLFERKMILFIPNH